MSRATAVIAEDEPVLRAEMRELLAQLWPDLQISGEAADGEEALRLVESLTPDIAFLDIHLPALSGLLVAQRASRRSHVVFITAFDQYAVTAFEQGAVDYVVKPLLAERFAVTVQRLQARLNQAPAELSGLIGRLQEGLAAAKPRHLKWLTVPVGNDLRLVTAQEICYLRADHKYTCVATRSSTYLLNASLRHMGEQLDPDTFWQVHRGIIVNVAAIHTVHRSFRGGLEIRLKERAEVLPVSASYAHLFSPP